MSRAHILDSVHPVHVHEPAHVQAVVGEHLVALLGLGLGGVHRLPGHTGQGFAGLPFDVVAVHVLADHVPPDEGDGVTPDTPPGHGLAPSRYRSSAAASNPPTTAASR